MVDLLIKFLIIFTSLIGYMFIGTKLFELVLEDLNKSGDEEIYKLSHIIVFWLPIIVIEIIKNVLIIVFNPLGKLAYDMFKKKER